MRGTNIQREALFFLKKDNPVINRFKLSSKKYSKHENCDFQYVVIRFYDEPPEGAAAVGCFLIENDAFPFDV